MRIDDTGRVSSFVEKPKTEAERKPYHTPAAWIEERGIPCRGRHYLANMGIYLFNTDFLHHILNERPLATDFGKEVFPRNVGVKKIQAHLFDGYWEDLGTIKSYHESSLALCEPEPPFDFYSPDGGVIYTRMRNLPASRVDGATLTRSLISDGCRVGAGSVIDHCLIGVRSHIGKNCHLTDTVVLGADKYEADAEGPVVHIGDGSVIRHAILDKGCRIGAGVRIENAAKRMEYDDPSGTFHIRDGIVCVPRGGIIPAETVI
jgi:glucose-1-phosphate adenylyltransferase